MMAGDSAGMAVMAEVHRAVGADLRGQVERLADERDVDIQFLVVHGDRVTKLRKVAEEVGADALVVSAPERTGHRFVGSIASRLVKAARWPVTVVP